MRSTKAFLEKVLNRFDKLSSDELYRLLTHIAKEQNISTLVLDSLYEGVIALDRDGNILTVNKQAAYLLHISNETTGKPLTDVIANSPFKKTIIDVCAKEETVEKVVVTDKRSERIISISQLPLAKQGVLKGTLILIADITENYRNEQELKRAEQLAALTTLAAGVAHEIKNPLGSLDIYIQLIAKVTKRMDANTKEVQEITEYVDIVKEEVGRLEEIVNSFLFSVRKLELQIEKTDMKEIITQTITFLKYEIEKNDVAVHVHFEDNLPPVEMDVRYIKQAMINIIQNAIDALAECDEKDISITCFTQEANRAIVTKIKDTGKGIPKKMLSKVFEPYYTTKRSGTGLGLTNVYRIVEAHHGHVTIQSEEEEGTEITLSLPITPYERKLLTGKEKHDADDTDN